MGACSSAPRPLEVEAVDVAAISNVESALAKAEEDTTLVDEALEDAAKAATLEAAQTGGDTSVAQAFAAVTTQQLHSEVVAPSPAPTAMPSPVPTSQPTRTPASMPGIAWPSPTVKTKLFRSSKFESTATAPPTGCRRWGRRRRPGPRAELVIGRCPSPRPSARPE